MRKNRWTSTVLCSRNVCFQVLFPKSRNQRCSMAIHAATALEKICLIVAYRG